MQQDANTNATDALVSVDGLTVAFTTDSGETQVLHGIDLDIFPGERVAIVGESGSGKSTVAAAIMGLLASNGRVSGGSITLRGQELTGASERDMRSIRGEQIGLVPQDPMSNLNPTMKVGAQIADTIRAHPASHGDLSRTGVKQRVTELMSLAGIPGAERRSRQYPHEFSGGMRQRVLIAIGLACNPQLLIADEPTSALDVTVQRQILDHLQTLINAEGIALLFITHDLGLAADRADRVIVMRHGRIVEQGTPEQILKDPREEYTRRLVDAAPSLVAVRDGSRDGDDDAAKVLSEPEAVAGAAGGAAAGQDALLRVRNLTKDYRIRGGGGTLRAVNDISFDVAPGTTTAIVGESGSGKTTLSRMVLGLEYPTSGTVHLGDEDIAAAKGARMRAARRRMQPVFQDPFGSLDPTYSIERLIDEPLRIFGIGDRASRRARVAELLDQVSLPRAVAQRRPAQLSGGQRQRVAIARALAINPQLVVCDEAVSALDVLVQDQILDLLAELQADIGLTYLFITHDLAVVRQIAHEVLVMKQGAVVESGPVDTIFQTPETEYTAQLLDSIPGAAFFA
ncbi:ABC transporter ATP-binding protein [Leucobacter sp. UCMA 4100]|uniref:dipeptide ABC transporter ATP-binding protein n=1 Tax=Leucobacter sp. UCMA 4100 TaxID=2810534 RepID=UPI0022EB2809|nr:ABC transporter ATP-binding protein [Leucobacter sp. UCMA 4100]MDA3146922.1 ABC transporter ATP-binding protein [Leucobacter sp. UCMA 4100]